MKPREYFAARDALGWSNAEIASVLGVSRRVPYRYASGDVEIPEPAARLLRLLVLLCLTAPKAKFDKIVHELKTR